MFFNTTKEVYKKRGEFISMKLHEFNFDLQELFFVIPEKYHSTAEIDMEVISEYGTNFIEITVSYNIKLNKNQIFHKLHDELERIDHNKKISERVYSEKREEILKELEKLKEENASHEKQ